MKLPPWHIQEYYDRAQENGRLDGKGGLSDRTILYHHRILRKALNRACKWQLVDRNVADLVDPPTPKKHKPQVLNLHEARRLIEIARPTEMYIPILLALTAGLRRSEVLGLLWSDVDFNVGVLRVRQTLQRVKQRTLYYQTKTENSCRVVGLPYHTLEALGL